METQKFPSLSIIIPAYNEVVGLEGSCDATLRALASAGIDDYEILIITDPAPDGSDDGTSELAARIAENNPKVRHFSEPIFVGLGFKYRKGIRLATKDWVMTVPAHNLTHESTLLNIMLHIGLSDAIFTYTENTEARPPEARFVSRAYVVLCNLLFGLDMKYYNGISVVKRDLLVKIPALANDHAFMVEAIVFLVKSGVSYVVLPQFLKTSERTGRLWNIENMLRVAGSLGSLFWRINIEEQRLDIPSAKLIEKNSFNVLGTSLPAVGSVPDFAAIFQLLRQNSIRTVHPILVHLVKTIATSLGLVGLKKDGTSNISFDPSRVMGIAKALSNLAIRTGTRMVMVGTFDKMYSKNGSRRRSKKKLTSSLSFVMPAYNVADQLREAYESVCRIVARAKISDYEIIIVSNSTPECTDDGTLNLADSIAKSDVKVSHISNSFYAGMGVRFRQGLSAAQKNYVMMVAGDGEFEEESMVNLVSNLGKAELIIPYISNPQARPIERQIVSQGFVSICNRMFGLGLRYYNGPCIMHRRFAQRVSASCDGYAYMAELLIYLIKSGISYREVSWRIKPSVSSKAFNLESVDEVLEEMTALFWKVNVEGQRVDLSD